MGQVGQMGQMGQMVPMGQSGQMGQMGPMGMGSMSSMGPMGPMGQMQQNRVMKHSMMKQMRSMSDSGSIERPMVKSKTQLHANQLSDQDLGDELRSFFKGGKGPVVIPLSSLQNVMQLEHQLEDIRTEIMHSFYADLVHYNMMSNKYKTSMKHKLNLLKQIESRLAV